MSFDLTASIVHLLGLIMGCFSLLKILRSDLDQRIQRHENVIARSLEAIQNEMKHLRQTLESVVTQTTEHRVKLEYVHDSMKRLESGLQGVQS